VIPSRLNFSNSAPVFLNNLVCSESDSNLLQCYRGGTLIGVTHCDHNQDVWIECRGQCKYVGVHYHQKTKYKNNIITELEEHCQGKKI